MSSGYRVYLQTTASMSVVVEAESRDEAVTRALDEYGSTTPCHQEPFELGDWDVPAEGWAVRDIEWAKSTTSGSGGSVTDLLPPEQYDGETLCAACGIGIETGRLFATCADIDAKTGKRYSHQETCEQYFANNPNEEFCDECGEQFEGRRFDSSFR